MNIHIEPANYKNILLVLYIFSFFKIYELFNAAQSLIVFFIFTGLLSFYLLILNFKTFLKIKNVNTKFIAIIIIYFILEFIALLRGFNVGSISLNLLLKLFLWQLLILLTGIHLLSTFKSRNDIKIVILFIVVGIYIYLLLNVVLYFVGFSGEAAYSYNKFSIIGRALNIEFPAVYYPLATGFKTISVITASIMVITIVMFIKRIYFFKNPFIALAGCLLCFFIIISVDSRSSFIAGLFSLSLLFLNRNFAFKIAQMSWLAFPFLPYIFLIFAGFFSEIDFINENFSRGSGNNIETLSGRLYIWQSVLNTYADAPIELIYGYGAHGQVYLNLLEGYDFLFEARTDNYSKSLHSTAMQILLDKGLVGLLIFMTMIFNMLKAYKNLGSIGMAILISFFAILIMSVTTSILIYSPIDLQTFFLLLLVISSSKFLTKSYKDKQIG
jgi:hypothetical protein